MKEYYSVEEIEKFAFEYLRTVVNNNTRNIEIVGLINDSTCNIEIVGKTAIEIFSFIEYIRDSEKRGTKS